MSLNNVEKVGQKDLKRERKPCWEKNYKKEDEIFFERNFVMNIKKHYAICTKLKISQLKYLILSQIFLTSFHKLANDQKSEWSLSQLARD